MSSTAMLMWSMIFGSIVGPLLYSHCVCSHRRWCNSSDDPLFHTLVSPVEMCQLTRAERFHGSRQLRGIQGEA